VSKKRDKHVRQFLDNYHLLRSAADLCSDDELIWSEDFDRIRLALAKWFRYEASMGNSANRHALKIADLLIEDELDISVKWWKEDDA